MADFKAAYLDQAGSPRLRESIVAFIDILGFSNIATTSGTIEDSQAVLDKIAEAIDDSRNFVRETIPEEELQRGGRWVTKFFSDNLAFGYPLGESVDEQARGAMFIVRSAQRYQLKMVMNGFFVRGALTQGPICLTDEIIFGSALIECYMLESKASIVPRIVLAEPLQRLITNAYREVTIERSPELAQAVCRDVDGWWFVNYLEAAKRDGEIQWELVERHKASILESLSHTTRH